MTQKISYRLQFHFCTPLVKDTAITNKPNPLQAAENYKAYLKTLGGKNKS